MSLFLYYEGNNVAVVLGKSCYYEGYNNQITMLLLLLQEQSCYYEGYKKQLTCQCDLNLAKAFLSLRLAFNVREIGQEVGQNQDR